jgi:hypothetical protein
MLHSIKPWAAKLELERARRDAIVTCLKLTYIYIKYKNLSRKTERKPGKNSFRIDAASN